MTPDRAIELARGFRLGGVFAGVQVQADLEPTVDYLRIRCFWYVEAVGDSVAVCLQRADYISHTMLVNMTAAEFTCCLRSWVLGLVRHELDEQMSLFGHRLWDPHADRSER